MQTTHAPPTSNQAGAVPVAELVKATLRRLAAERLEPTPENYARAWALERGGSRPAALPDAALPLVQRLAERAFGDDTQSRARPVAQALAEGQWDRAQALLSAGDEGAHHIAALIERLVRGIEHGGRGWTLARKKEGLHRVLEGSRSDSHRLRQRLQQLLASWDCDAPDAAIETAGPSEPGADPGTPSSGAGEGRLAPSISAPQAAAPALRAVADTEVALQAWQSLLESLCGALASVVPEIDADARRVRQTLMGLPQHLRDHGATPALADEMAKACKVAQRTLQHRHHLNDQLGRLCTELTASMADLAESGSWVRGQCDAMHHTLKDGVTARGVKAVNELLGATRKRQSALRSEREHARDALKTLIGSMLGELNELGSHTGRFQDKVGRYTDVIEQADTLESLTLVVREMVTESRAVHDQVAQTQARLHEEHAKATGLSQRVSELENELQRLAEEVTTDQLTQIANRRGLLKVFEVERARMERGGSPLSIGLLDIDNFKRLNDELGHAAGDVALKSLAAFVTKTLRPTDLVARYGGEEFVVLLPETALPDAQATLTRLQRQLSSGLFLHEQKEVLVTFSAGVTACRNAERIEDALERADQALYEAKRTGKNRTCVA